MNEEMIVTHDGEDIPEVGMTLEPVPKQRPLERFGIKINRFAGTKMVHLVGKRTLKDEETVQIYEINIARKSAACETPVATVSLDGQEKFKIVASAMNSSKLEKVAVSALHRFIKVNNYHHELRKRRRAEKAADKAKAIAAGEES